MTGSNCVSSENDAKIDTIFSYLKINVICINFHIILAHMWVKIRERKSKSYSSAQISLGSSVNMYL